jgi:hypothetical protein
MHRLMQYEITTSLCRTKSTQQEGSGRDLSVIFASLIGPSNTNLGYALSTLNERPDTVIVSIVQSQRPAMCWKYVKASLFIPVYLKAARLPMDGLILRVLLRLCRDSAHGLRKRWVLGSNYRPLYIFLSSSIPGFRAFPYRILQNAWSYHREQYPAIPT